jgi:hypothetical protein
MGMDGFTNITFLKNGIIERSTMTGPQKMSASAALESCMESDLTIPQINGVDELSKIPEKGIFLSRQFKHSIFIFNNVFFYQQPIKITLPLH